MADAVTTQTLRQTLGDWVMAFTNVSDGTGEAAVTKVDVSTLTGAAATSRVQIIGLWWSTCGMGVQLLWDATTDVLAWALPADTSGYICFEPGGIINNAGSGNTGDIKLTTVGHSSGDTYNIVLHLRRSG